MQYLNAGCPGKQLRMPSGSWGMFLCNPMKWMRSESKGRVTLWSWGRWHWKTVGPSASKLGSIPQQHSWRSKVSNLLGRRIEEVLVSTANIALASGEVCLRGPWKFGGLRHLRVRYVERVVRHWNRLSREMVESPSWKCLRDAEKRFLGTWFTDCLWLMVEVDLKGLV